MIRETLTIIELIYKARRVNYERRSGNRKVGFSPRIAQEHGMFSPGMAKRFIP